MKKNAIKQITLIIALLCVSCIAEAKPITQSYFFNGQGFNLDNILEISSSAKSQDEIAKIASSFFENGKQQGVDDVNGINNIRKSFFLATLFKAKEINDEKIDDIIFNVSKFCGWSILDMVDSQYIVLARIFPLIQDALYQEKRLKKTNDEKRLFDGKVDYSGTFKHISDEVEGQLTLRRINQKWYESKGFLYGYEWTTENGRTCSGTGYFAENLFVASDKCYFALAIINSTVKIFPSNSASEKQQFEGVWYGVKK